MKRILFAILFLLALPAFSQNVVYKFPEFSPENSLIREYTKGVDIIYIIDGQASFLYFDKII